MTDAMLKPLPLVTRGSSDISCQAIRPEWLRFVHCRAPDQLDPWLFNLRDILLIDVILSGARGGAGLGRSLRTLGLGLYGLAATPGPDKPNRHSGAAVFILCWSRRCERVDQRVQFRFPPRLPQTPPPSLALFRSVGRWRATTIRNTSTMQIERRQALAALVTPPGKLPQDQRRRFEVWPIPGLKQLQGSRAL
jgi:hypothetical protein